MEATPMYALEIVDLVAGEELFTELKDSCSAAGSFLPDRSFYCPRQDAPEAGTSGFLCFSQEEDARRSAQRVRDVLRKRGTRGVALHLRRRIPASALKLQAHLASLQERDRQMALWQQGGGGAAQPTGERAPRGQEAAALSREARAAEESEGEARRPKPATAERLPSLHISTDWLGPASKLPQESKPAAAPAKAPTSAVERPKKRPAPEPAAQPQARRPATAPATATRPMQHKAAPASPASPQDPAPSEAPAPPNEEVRAKARQKLANALQALGDKAAALAGNIEAELLRREGTTNKRYKDTTRALAFNLPRNPELQEGLASGSLTPAALVHMRNEDLARREVVEWRRSTEQLALNRSVLSKDTAAVYFPAAALDLMHEERQRGARPASRSGPSYAADLEARTGTEPSQGTEAQPPFLGARATSTDIREANFEASVLRSLGGGAATGPLARTGDDDYYPSALENQAPAVWQGPADAGARVCWPRAPFAPLPAAADAAHRRALSSRGGAFWNGALTWPGANRVTPEALGSAPGVTLPAALNVTTFQPVEAALHTLTALNLRQSALTRFWLLGRHMPAAAATAGGGGVAGLTWIMRSGLVLSSRDEGWETPMDGHLGWELHFLPPTNEVCEFAGVGEAEQLAAAATHSLLVLAIPCWWGELMPKGTLEPERYRVHAAGPPFLWALPRALDCRFQIHAQQRDEFTQDWGSIFSAGLALQPHPSEADRRGLQEECARLAASGSTLVAQKGMPKKVEVLVAPEPAGRWLVMGAWSGPQQPVMVYDVWDNGTLPPNTPRPGRMHSNLLGR